jgi:hypothetical protein
LLCRDRITGANANAVGFVAHPGSRDIGAGIARASGLPAGFIAALRQDYASTDTGLPYLKAKPPAP